MDQESATGATNGDEQEIRALMARLADSWARGDAQAYGAEFTDDCDYVAFDGTRFRGPAEPATHLARLFDTVLKDSRLEGEVESVRFVGPEVAVVHWTGSVAYPWQRRVRRRRTGTTQASLTLAADVGSMVSEPRLRPAARRRPMELRAQGVRFRARELPSMTGLQSERGNPVAPGGK